MKRKEVIKRLRERGYRVQEFGRTLIVDGVFGIYEFENAQQVKYCIDIFAARRQPYADITRLMQ